MDESKGIERRREVRQPLALQVTYDDDQGFLGDWTENISKGGIFIRTEMPFVVGDSVSLSLSFPGLLEPIEVAGVITWVRPAKAEQPRGVGVQVQGANHRRRLAEIALLVSQNGDQPIREYDVVVVDDNPHIARIYERVLKHLADTSGNRINVRFAQNGHEALSALRKKPAQLLITDLYMPIMDGFALIREVRADTQLRGLAVLATTGGTGDEDLELRPLGIDALVRKPFQFGPLLETVICLLRR